MRRLPILVALTVLLGPAASAAAPGRVFISPSGEPFRPTPQAPDPFAAWFARADANHDGHIDRAEFRADAVAFFKVLDANGDGVIDGFEMNGYEHKIAPELAAEVESFGHERESGEREGGRGHDGHGRPSGGGSPATPPPAGTPVARGGQGHLALINEPEPVAGADADFDSKVTAAEWLTATDRRFDQLDDKKLGYLDLAGLETHLPKPVKPKQR